MKTTHILILLTVFSAMIASCKKYEDGPSLSLKTKKSRVANEWIYNEVTSPNGTNITSSYANSFLEFKKDDSYIQTSSSYSYTGTWQFASGKEDIVMTESGSGDSETLHILRLKEKELWFTVEDYLGTYEYHMSQR